MQIIKTNETKLDLLENGSISKITVNEVMINQVEGNIIDGSFANIYLRFKKNNKYIFHPLMGPESASEISYTENTVSWKGTFEKISYELKLLVEDKIWFWEINLDGKQKDSLDITYTQDLGLGLDSFVKSNEAYASQYIDHHIVENDEMIDIASRQNQPQDNQFPYLQQGSFNELASYSTDGFQFFGTEYKQSGIPKSLNTENLENYNKQYECAFIALRTKKINLNSQKKIVFYNAFSSDQKNGNTDILFNINDLKDRYTTFNIKGVENKLDTSILKFNFGQKLSGQKLSDTELNELFPIQKQVEKQNDEILSFFSKNDSHIVLPSKEKLQDRLSGNITLSTTEIMPGTSVLATTQYITGVFESHTVYGNTNFNVLSTDVKDALNIFTVAGTRIRIRKPGDTEYQILGMPSAFVMYFNGADWYYKFDEDLLIISVDSSADNNQLNLTFHSKNGIKYTVMTTMQINHDALGKEPKLEYLSERVTVSPEKNTAMFKKNSELGYQIDFSNNNSEELSLISSKLLFNQDIQSDPDLIVGLYDNVSDFTIKTGLQNKVLIKQNIQKTREKHFESLNNFYGDLKLETTDESKSDLVSRTNLIIPWFIHDALVHLLSPHGLEQYGGAAWGTRDVSQGPTELFLSTGHYEEVREIILKTYAHQLIETGNWPQWFMFDEYSGEFADESHGDVIVWPLKVVSDYILKTNDYSILDEKISYMSAEQHKLLDEKVSLSDHIKKQVNYVKDNFLYDTYVSAYGDGDWDDTLQPANAEQKKTMASTWTEELTIETFRNSAQAFKNIPEFASEFEDLANKMMMDFKKYFMNGDTLPGFIKMDADHQIEPIIYPGDKKTKIDYRLLPLSQGVLSKILTGKQADNAIDLIQKHLLYSDGVHLMNRPSIYHGGVSKVFKRAEQSANFGREIGLMYVHAHIRYAAAIASIGDYSEAWRLLDLVNPIKLEDRVKNAELRQANVYFSSSDADFSTRYDAQNSYDKLREQKVGIKGGWRLYSSGPGIYIGTLLTDIFKIKNLKIENKENYLPFDKQIIITKK